MLNRLLSVVELTCGLLASSKHIATMPAGIQPIYTRALSYSDPKETVLSVLAFPRNQELLNDYNNL